MGNIEVEYKFDDLIPGLSAKLNMGYDLLNGKMLLFAHHLFQFDGRTNFNGEIYLE